MRANIVIALSLAAAVLTCLASRTALPQGAPALPADTSKLIPSTLPGYRTAQLKCGLCHSADYINLQPPGMTTPQWTAEMVKMQKTYGAPLSDAEIAQLGEYLGVTYGGQTPAGK